MTKQGKRDRMEVIKDVCTSKNVNCEDCPFDDDRGDMPCSSTPNGWNLEEIDKRIKGYEDSKD